MAFETVRQPMFALLLGSAIVYLILGSAREAAVLFFFGCSSIAIAIIQEGRSERVLDRLRELTSPRALVIRSGERHRIPGREVVRGDIVILNEGDRVPADAAILSSADLVVDESLLTGESVPVAKREARGPVDLNAVPGGDDLPIVFSGTLVVRGQGLAEVFATGARSQIGRIGRMLAGIETVSPRLTDETRVIVRCVAVVGFLCCVIAVILFGVLRGGWLQAILAGIALGMSVLPEEFPVVITVFTVMGAWRLSRARVLVRRAAAIETLGSATVLCTDKTGTLTENRMSVVELRTESQTVRIPADFAEKTEVAALRVLRGGALASAIDPFDPMEKALHALHASVANRSVADKKVLSRAYPLTPSLLAVTHAWSNAEGKEALVAAKGAPESIIELCRLSGPKAEAIRNDVNEMAASGQRVLAVAEARHSSSNLPDSPRGFEFSYLGLIGFSDPLRDSVPDAVRECQRAGIRVIMITGDYPETARAIARQAGLPSDNILTGADIATQSDTELGQAIGHVCIFARITPEHKLRLIRAMKQRGEVVAMTGDGVNDAPALRAADIGIAMGGRGTDVAREASSIILLDDDFASIVRTIRLGRRIYDNLRKAMSYILAVHVPIAGMALLPLVTGLPLILGPIHIAFLEMVIDPVCSVAFEAEGEEKDVMTRPPRSPKARLLSSHVVMWCLLQGGTALAAVATIYFGSHLSGMTTPDLRTLTFITLVAVNLGLVLVNRTLVADPISQLARPNRSLLSVAAAAVLILSAAVLWQPARSVFEFGHFHWHDLGIVLAAAAMLVLVLDMLKRLRGTLPTRRTLGFFS